MLNAILWGFLATSAQSGSGLLSEIIFVVTISFPFIQSTVVADVGKSKKSRMKILVLSMIILIWLKPIDYNSFIFIIEMLKLSFFYSVFLLYQGFACQNNYPVESS